MEQWGRYYYSFFLFWYGCGLVLVGFNLLPSWLEWANVLFLVLAGGIGILYFFARYGMKKGLLLSLLVFCIGMISEYLGATYGYIFGDYYYTNHFGIKVMGVPIGVGFAWVMVIGTTDALASVITQHWLWRIVIGALAATILDLILDPVSYVVKQYWIWSGSSMYYNIPYKNFLGWFEVAFCLHMLLFLLTRKTKEKKTKWHQRCITTYYLILIMFSFIGLLKGLYLALGITMGCTLFMILLYQRGKKRDYSQEDSLVL